MKDMQSIQKHYEAITNPLVLGAAKYNDTVRKDFQVKIPLSMMNRHGLISGATGTGKTKTVQLLAEELSKAGVCCLLMDMKGDLSGLGKIGEKKDYIDARHQVIGMPWEPLQIPVQYYSLSGSNGTPMRATLSEFGPELLSRILELNDVQEGVLQVLFRFADQRNLPILDLKDLQALCRFVQEPDVAQTIKKEYGLIRSASISTIMRSLLSLQQQGAEIFFGEPSFDVNDLIYIHPEGKGLCSIIRLSDIQNKPKLFSTFMLCLMAEIYHSFPERGDMEKPLLCVFIDEAHLIFENASKSLLEQIEMMARLIRSKGIGLFFITQNPTDIPQSILSQLGLKIQHALRAFTEKDRKAIRAMADNFPASDVYNIQELLTGVGIGEAIVCGLDPKGMPLPPVHTLLKSPSTRMDVISENELSDFLRQSALHKKYTQLIDRQSAYEILQKKIETLNQDDNQPESLPGKSPSNTPKKNPKSSFENILISTVTRTIVRELTRGLLGILGLTSQPKSRRRF